jgi:hypothetical protein
MLGIRYIPLNFLRTLLSIPCNRITSVRSITFLTQVRKSQTELEELQILTTTKLLETVIARENRNGNFRL